MVKIRSKTNLPDLQGSKLKSADTLCGNLVSTKSSWENFDFCLCFWVTLALSIALTNTNDAEANQKQTHRCICKHTQISQYRVWIVLFYAHISVVSIPLFEPSDELKSAAGLNSDDKQEVNFPLSNWYVQDLPYITTHPNLWFYTQNSWNSVNKFKPKRGEKINFNRL